MKKSNKQAFKTILIKNYLEQVMNEQIFVYYNLTNGFKQLKRDITTTNGHGVFVLVEMIDDIEESATISGCNIKAISSKFDNIELLREELKLELPDDIKLLLLIIPKMISFNRETIFTFRQFEALKNQILSLDNNIMYNIFNRLMNDNLFNSYKVVYGLNEIMRDAQFNPLVLMFGERNIDQFQFNQAKNNLKRLTIKMISMEEITNYDLKSKYVKELIEIV